VAGYLDNLLNPVADCLTPEAAQQLIDLEASADTRARLNELADKSNEGRLSPEERAEYEAYVHAIDLIGILQARVRQQLRRA
jgi:hypothetical protein